MGNIIDFPGYQPCERDRIIVENAAAIGEPQERLARFLGTSVTTLRRYYADELDNGLFRANLKIGKTLYELATEAKEESVRFKACSYWLSRRAGWKESGGVNVNVGITERTISANMTAQQALEAYQAMLRSSEIPVIADENG